MPRLRVDYGKLGREGSSGPNIYCWANPIGAMKGAVNEFYGKFLLKIG